MKNRQWLNVGLLAAVAVLALFAYLKPHQSEPEHRLSTLKANDVKRLRIEISGSPPIVLERVAAEWRLTAPVAARADNFQTQRLLAVLDATSKDRLPAGELARFDLNEPHARVTIGQQTFSFGAVNQMSREQYLLTQDGVYLVPLRYGAALPKNALQLVSRQLFAADEAPVAFEFKEFSLAQRDGKWVMSPAAADMSQDDINRWIGEWRLATALAVQAADNRTPLATIKVRLRSGSDLTLAVLQREPEFTLARSDQPSFAYQFAGETAKRLLAPPAAQSQATAGKR